MADEMINHVYRVFVTREDGMWLADVPELEGAHTFARSLPSLDKAVREVVVLAADLPDEAMQGLRLEFEYQTGDPRIDDDAARIRQLRAQVAEVESLTAASILALTPELSVRDAGMLLGVSPQRVSQVAGKRAVSGAAHTGSVGEIGRSTRRMPVSTSKKAAKAAGKQLAKKTSTKAQKRVAASDLAQAKKNKKR